MVRGMWNNVSPVMRATGASGISRNSCDTINFAEVTWRRVFVRTSGARAPDNRRDSAALCRAIKNANTASRRFVAWLLLKTSGFLTSTAFGFCLSKPIANQCFLLLTYTFISITHADEIIIELHLILYFNEMAFNLWRNQMILFQLNQGL